MTMSNTGRRAVRQKQSATGRTGARAQTPTRPRSLLRRLAVALVLLTGLAGVAAAAGFLAFTAQIAAREPAAVRSADAIVVLTGGPSRIVDAVGLLADGRGRRLLITGVNPATSMDEMRRALPDGEHLLGCCIDLGHKALNTRGNALEAAEWAREKRFRSLVVVTSSWHMPRAMMELGRALPDVELVSYPVVTTRTQPESWWSDPGTLNLLVKEYLKFVMATVKIRPAQAVAGAGEAPRPAPPASVAPATLRITPTPIPTTGAGFRPAEARLSP
ncbi:YdcF family protein [Xanthobacter oligotrophicus]|uniref:YdcF family protein n=1 Tax=Xanthobacter oligotrophicus TaxID=2607286 RepID=UPI001E38A53A|nr:YdcF family protein [Xanthobacter oligotrophicus]MCG5235104.1 YdcF family protein [Xanthobacter oligotrophicus]